LQVCGKFSSHDCATKWLSLTFSHHHEKASHCGLIVNVWFQKKGQSGQRYRKIRVNFALHFNKAALTEAKLCKPEKKVPTQFCDPRKIKWKTTDMWVSVHIWRITQKIHKAMLCRIPDSKNLHVTSDKKRRQP
jgi:hypothetical protein